MVTLLDARSSRVKANYWTPSTERSDLAKPVNGHIVSGSRQFRTTARAGLAWPDDRQLEVAGPGLGTARVTMLSVGQSAFKALVLGA